MLRRLMQSEVKPLLDSRLPNGSRVAAVFPPCSVGGTTLTIHKFQSRYVTAAAVIVRELLRAALRHKPNRIILGEVRGGEVFDLLCLFEESELSLSTPPPLTEPRA